jgi:hypothetical protein
MVDFARELNKAGVESYSPGDVSAALQRFTMIQEQLKTELSAQNEKIANRFASETGLNASDIISHLEGKGGLSEEMGRRLSAFTDKTVDDDTGISYDIGQTAYKRTISVIESYLSKLREKSDSEATTAIQDQTISALNDARVSLAEMEPGMDKSSVQKLAGAMASLEAAIRQLDFNRIAGSLDRMADYFDQMHRPDDNLGTSSSSSIAAFLGGKNIQDRSFLDAPIDAIKQISRGYGKFATISTNLGAIINGVGELLKSARNPDAGTPLDFTRSGVKIFDALKNIGYQVGLTNSPANTDRSATLVDIVHAGARLWKDIQSGQLGRAPVRQVIESPSTEGAYTTEEERLKIAGTVFTRDFLNKRGFRDPLSNAQGDALKSVLQNMAQGQEVTLQDFFKIWKDGPKPEVAAQGPQILSELMTNFKTELAYVEAQKKLNALKPQVDVLHERGEQQQEARRRRQAARESAQQQQYGAPPTAGPSPYLSGQGGISAYMSEAQQNLNDFMLAQMSRSDRDRYADNVSVMRSHFGGTDLDKYVDNFAVIDPRQSRGFVQSLISELGHSGAEARQFEDYAQRGMLGGLGGGNVNAQTGDARGFAVIMDSKGYAKDAAHVMTHELIHALTQTNADILKDSDAVDTAHTEQKMYMLQHGDKWLEGIKENFPDFTDVAEVISSNPFYFYTSNERLSNVGAAHLSGDQKYEDFYREAYGDALYEEAIQRLKTAFPDTFSDDQVEKLRGKYDTFAQQTQEMYKSKDAPEEPDLLGSAFDRLIDTLRQGLSIVEVVDKAFTSLWATIRRFLSRLGIGPKDTESVGGGINTGEDGTAGPDAYLKQVASGFKAFDDQVMKIIDDFDSPEVTDAISRTVQALNRTLGHLETAATNTANNMVRVGGALAQSWAQQQNNPIINLAERVISDPILFNTGATAEGKSIVDVGMDTFMDFMRRELVGERRINKFVNPREVAKLVQNNVNTQVPFTDKTVGDLLSREVGAAIAPRMYGGADFDEIRLKMNERLKRFGDVADKSTLDVKSTYDFAEGLMRISASAETAAGQMVEFNGHIDSFGNLVEDVEKKQDGFFENIKRNLWQLPMEVMQESVEELAFGFMALVGQIINVQDELAEVSLLLTSATASPEEMSAAGTDFLYSSISAASATGQQFDEGIQTNIRNLKQLAFVPDQEARQRIAEELSTIQLGAQTAFGLTLEESLETLPAIFSQLQSSVEIPEEIAAGMTSSEQATYRAEEALKRLKEVMNGLVIAQRESGANGEDLAQVYASLAGSAKDAALSQEELFALASVASVKLTGGSDEIANSLKFIMERTYGSGADELRSLGIETTELKTDESGRTVVAPRNFMDILAEAQVMRKAEPEKSKAITGALGSQRRANEALLLLEGVPEQQRITSAAEELGTGGNEFMDLVTRKSEQFGGQLNKAQASLALFLNEVLFGTGIMDDLGGVLGNVAGLMEAMATAMSDHPEAVEAIKNIGKAILTGVVYASTRAVNAFSVFAKGINYLTGSIRSLIISFSQIGKAGPVAFTPLQRYAQLAASTMDKLQSSSQRAFSPFLAGTQQAVKGVDQVTASVDRLNQELDQTNQKSSKGIAGISPQRSNIREFVGGLAGEKTSFWQTRPGVAIQGAGSFLGSMAAPVGFDLLSGGFNSENIAEIGAGLAGGIAGFFLGGPGGSIIGYSIAKGAADYLDVTGMFGTSSTEIDTTLQAFSEAYRGLTETPVEAKTREEQEARSSEVVQEFLDNTGLAEVITSAISKRDNQGFFGNTQMPVNAGNLQRYRSMVEGEAPPWWDAQSKLFRLQAQPDATGFSAAQDIGAIYDVINASESPELLDFLINAKFSNFEELQQMMEDMIDPSTEIGREMKSIVSSIDAARDAQEEFNIEIGEAGDSYKPLKSSLDEIDDKLELLREKSRFLYSIPVGLDQFGAFGEFTRQIDETYGGRIAGFEAEGSQSDYNAVMEQYNTARTSAMGLPSALGLTMPVAEQLGQDLNQDELMQALYQGGTDLQNQWTSMLQPMTEMLGFVAEYELTMERIAAIEASPELAGGVTEELQGQYEAELATLLQKKDIQSAMYEEYKGYLSLIMQEPGLLASTLQSLQQKAAVQRKVEARVVGGSAPQFRLPSGVDVSEYSTADIAEALDAARARQDNLVNMFPEAAAEFAKQQFLLESGGQVRGVTGVSSSFFQEALRDSAAAQKNLQAPNIEDFRGKSDQEIADILARARALQGQAVELAPDLAKDLEDERLLVLRKNNELLMETGLSQEYLRLAMEDNTDATNATLRGHYNLPGSYRPPTIWDYYNEGGREAGSENFPGAPGGDGSMVPISFARDLANKMLQEGSGSEGGANLDELGGLIDPNARPLGYPNPGSPGTVIMPPDLELPDGIDTNEINVNGVPLSDILRERMSDETKRLPDGTIVEGEGVRAPNPGDDWGDAYSPRPLILPEEPVVNDELTQWRNLSLVNNLSYGPMGGGGGSFDGPIEGNLDVGSPDWEEALPPSSMWDKAVQQTDDFGNTVFNTGSRFDQAMTSMRSSSADTALGLVGVAASASAQTSAMQLFANSVTSITKQIGSINIANSLAQAINNGRIEIEIKSDGSRPRATVLPNNPPPPGSTKGQGGNGLFGTGPSGNAKP